MSALDISVRIPEHPRPGLLLVRRPTRALSKDTRPGAAHSRQPISGVFGRVERIRALGRPANGVNQTALESARQDAPEECMNITCRNTFPFWLIFWASVRAQPDNRASRGLIACGHAANTQVRGEPHRKDTMSSRTQPKTVCQNEGASRTQTFCLLARLVRTGYSPQSGQ